MATKRVMKVWEVYWSPTGQKIDTVKATTARAAKRKAPQPYRKYLGEIYVKEVGAANPRRRKRSANPHTHLIPAKVIVGKGGKMRVFVSGKAARELAGHRMANPSATHKVAKIPGYKTYAIFRVSDKPSPKNWVSGPYKTKRAAVAQLGSWNR